MLRHSSKRLIEGLQDGAEAEEEEEEEEKDAEEGEEEVKEVLTRDLRLRMWKG